MEARSPAVANVGELVARCARAFGPRLAIKSGGRNLTYAQLERRSNQLANALIGLGLQRGDRVGFYLPNCAEIIEIELACYKAGLVKAPFNARLSPVEVAEVIANSEAALVVTSAERAESFLPWLKGAAPRLLFVEANAGSSTYEGALEQASDAFQPVTVRADDLAVLHYTSGSSGVLKAAMQTFGNRLAQLRKFHMRSEAMQAGDVLGLVGPISHASGMNIVPALCRGVTIRLFSGFEPESFMADMRADRGMPFNQMMSFPSELTLRTTPAGVRMFWQPVKEISNLYGQNIVSHGVELLPGQAVKDQRGGPAAKEGRDGHQMHTNEGQQAQGHKASQDNRHHRTNGKIDTAGGDHQRHTTRQ